MRTNQKIINTEDKIMNAFIKIVNQDGFDKLSVKNITETAHINRSTFYNHYVDKYALITHYENIVIKGINDIINKNFLSNQQLHKVDATTMQVYPIYEVVLNYIADNFDLFRVLLGPNGDSQVENKLKEMLKKIIDNDIYNVKGNTKMTAKVPKVYAQTLVINSMIDVTKIWLLNNDPNTVNDVVSIITKTRFMSPYELLGFKE